MLRSVQESWDRSETFVSTQNDLAAEREARKAEAQRDADAADAARRQADADQLKAQLRDRYLSLPGTNEQDFEHDFPQLLQDHRRRQLDQREQADDQASWAMRKLVTQNF